MRSRLHAELYVDGAWEDITSDVYTRDEVSLTRGKANESGQAAPSAMNLSLNNRDGKYSPRNPLSPYYGKIARNTPIRVSAAAATSAALIVPHYDDTASHLAATTPDHTSLDIVGDIDLRAKVSGMVGWANIDDATVSFVNKIVYKLYYDQGALCFLWYDSGSVSHFKTAGSLPDTDDARWVRVTLDVNNGAAGHTVQFYTSTDGVTWAPFGAAQVTAGVTDIFSGVNTLRVGDTVFDIFNGPGQAEIHAVQVRNGIGGTIVANPDFSAQAYGTTSFTDSAGKVWSLFSPAVIGPSYLQGGLRFWGEVAAFPSKWDVSGEDAYVPIEAAGLLRRLGQGRAPAASGLRAFTLSSTGLNSYWPLDGAAGTTYSVDLAGSSRYQFTTASGSSTYGLDLGEYSGGEYLGTGMALFFSAVPRARGDVGTGADAVAFDFVFQSLALGTLEWEFDTYGDGTWFLKFDAGVASVTLRDNDGAVVTAFSPTAALSALTDQAMHHCRFERRQNGAATDWSLWIDGVLVDSGTQAVWSNGGLSTYWITYSRLGTQSYVVLAHLTVWSAATVTWPTVADTYAAFLGYVGETAGRRIERICNLAGIGLVPVGDLDDTERMGAQHSEAVLSQLRDAEDTDLGVLTEPRDAFGLLYRTRSSLYAQTPLLTIDYAAGELAPPFEPVEDDQLTRNDITVSRRDGGSVQAVADTGALSVLEPPLGVGRYEDSVTVNVETDGQLDGLAAWLLNLGTLDEARYPSITVNLAAPDTVGIVAAALAVDVGDLLVITNADAVGIYDDIPLIVLGYSEQIGPAEHRITFNCAPASTYDVAVYGSGVGSGPDRYDAEGSELTSGIFASQTSVSVTNTGATVWTTDAGEFPFDIFVGGERIRVTNITGATTPQTFTVVRAQNGVVKAHSAGAAVRLWDTPRYAL